MKHYFKYLLYVLEHKKNVFKIAIKKGETLHAFTHDLSKFHPKEFFAYADNFFGEKDCKKCKDYMKCDYNHIGLGSGNFAKECKDYRHKDFKEAWEHHFRHNKHHWNYWLYDWDMYLDTPFVTLEDCKLEPPKYMPRKYCRHMIIDWEAMSLKFGGSAQEYYLKNYNKIILNPESRVTASQYLKLGYPHFDYCEAEYWMSIKDVYEMYSENEYKRQFRDNKLVPYYEENFKVNLHNLFKDTKKE